MPRSELKQQVLSAQNVAAAWGRIKGDQNRWSAGIGRRELMQNPVLYCTQLVNELREQRYRPAGLTRLSVQKPNGKQRLLGAYYAKDKMAQRLVLNQVQPLLEAVSHPCSFGYRPGRDRFQALDKARQHLKSGLPWVVDADLQTFFDSIPHRQLKRRLRDHLSCRWCSGLIEAWIDEGYYPATSLITKRGIPQGAIISPYLCNLYLTEFDRFLEQKGIAFVRYADDFLLFAANEKQAEQVRVLAQRQLKRMGLKLNPDKTAIKAVKQGVEFLGLKLS